MPVTVLRFLLFAALTFVAAVVGRATTDESLGASLVWPLYGVGVLWLATGDRRSLPWDTLGLAAVTGATIWSTAAAGNWVWSR